MPNYRRAFIPGGCWFFTVAVLDRRQRLLTDHIDALREATGWTLRHHPFHIDAFVVLPDHIHAVWTLPPNDADFALRWRMIKIRFSRAMPRTEQLNRSRAVRGERGIWQRRFWEHLVRNESDYARHVEYCYINPVKHGLVTRVRDWPHSSFHRDVRAGVFPEDWAGDVGAPGEFGE
ncbi:MAG: transposase [Bradyrhizobiaceae bacterium]|nr:MAG: transposase [Bradyrhizobiaceae bacterium]